MFASVVAYFVQPSSSSHALRGKNVPPRVSRCCKMERVYPWSNRGNGVMLNVDTSADEGAGKASAVTIEIRVDSSVSLVGHWWVTGPGRAVVWGCWWRRYVCVVFRWCSTWAPLPVGV